MHGRTVIYLVGFVFWWLADVGAPLVVGGGGAALLWLLLGWTALRGRPRLVRRGFVLLLLGALGWVAYGTHTVWFRFQHPQFAMFERCVAKPIPTDVRDLEVDSAAPAMFHDGAIVRFRAAADTRQAILAHTLPGSSLRQIAAELAARLDRDPAVLGRIAGPDGGYLRYDPAALAAFDRPEWALVLGRFRSELPHGPLRPAPDDRDVFVYAERGDWGTLVAVATIERGTGAMTVHVQPMIRPHER